MRSDPFTRTIATLAALALMVVLCPLVSPGLLAQQDFRKDGEALRFEVASVKPSQSRGGLRLQPSLLSTPGATLRTLISFAYRMPLERVIGGDDWLRTELFEVQARAAQLSDLAMVQALDVAPRMLRALLADRFALTIANETRAMPVYVLRVKDTKRSIGSALRPTDRACEEGRARLATVPARANVPGPDSQVPGRPASPGVQGRNAVPTKPCFLGMGQKNGIVTWQALSTNMAELLEQMEAIFGKPIVDETGIQGNFGFELNVAKSEVPIFAPLSAGPTKAEADGPTLADAFAKDMNMSIRVERRPAPVLVVTHAEHPTPN